MFIGAIGGIVVGISKGSKDKNKIRITEEENPIFNVMGFSGYDVKNKYEWIGYNDKKNNKK